jgi:TATA element modulatory factor
LEKERFQANKKQESLKWELQNVRADIMRLEQQHGLREDMLRKEITNLQQQLREAEIRNNELTQSISNCTKPLLRQIENIQVSHQSQVNLLENAEKNLMEKLSKFLNDFYLLIEKLKKIFIINRGSSKSTI